MARRRYVSRGPKEPQKSKVLIFLNVVIGVLLALLLIVFFGRLSELNSNYHRREFGDGYEHYTIEDGRYRYGGILGRVNKGSEEAAAVAEYADAAFRHSAYEYAGESEKAARQKQRMDAAITSMGLYTPEAAKIDNLLK